MKHIDYLYFNIYDYFHRLSSYRQNFNARIQAVYLFSLGLGGWLLLLQTSYLHFIKHNRFSSRGESAIFAFSIYMLTAAMSNYIFIIKHRDLKILDKYEEIADQNPRRRRHFVISLSILIIPYLILLASAVIFPRYR